MTTTIDQFSSSQQRWIWQQTDWPCFNWDDKALAASLREVHQLQGKLLGKIDAVNQQGSAASELDALLQNIVQSSAIEGENLNVGSVRSSLAKRLGVNEAGLSQVTAQTEGLAELLLDATKNHQQPLTLERLYQWHSYLFPALEEGHHRMETLRIGELRGDEVMQVVSGPINRRVVHFEAPPKTVADSVSSNLSDQLACFLDWLETSRKDSTLDPILRAAQAHLWFVTLHPFDDGNGRLARAISDYALAQAEDQSVRFYAMAASIMEKRKEYYDILETTQKNDLTITQWMAWFLEIFQDTLENALTRIDTVLQKARFWQLHSQDGLNAQQTKVLNRLLDAGPEGFEGYLNANKYKGIAGVSKATATRHLTDMLDKNCLRKREGGGRSTSYDINWP